MPIYEYHCNGCEREFEVLVQSMAAQVKCSECGSGDLQRKFSVFGMKTGKSGSSSSKSSCSSCSSHSCGSCGCH